TTCDGECSQRKAPFVSPSSQTTFHSRRSRSCWGGATRPRTTSSLPSRGCARGGPTASSPGSPHMGDAATSSARHGLRDRNVPFPGYLPNDEIRRLPEAADAGGLIGTVPRVLLLNGIPGRFAAGLEQVPSPLNQFMLDLVNINKVERMANGLVPIVTL